MPELIRCPACGFGMQMAEGLLGRTVCCAGCSHRFVAADNVPPRLPSPPPPAPDRGARPWDEDSPRDEERGPFCPGCGKRVGWEALSCPSCGEELEPEEGGRRWRRERFLRRDSEPHRGALIATLGNTSMIVGALSLCVCGLGAAISVPLGAAAWVMANHDLEQMRAGLMDPAGRGQTEAGRTGAIVGILLGVLFASFFGVMYFHRF